MPLQDASIMQDGVETGEVEPSPDGRHSALPITAQAGESVCSGCAKEDRRVLRKVYKELQTLNRKRLARAVAYKVKKIEEEAVRREKRASDFRQSQREMREYERAARKKRPPYQLSLTEEEKEKWRDNYLQNLAKTGRYEPEAKVEELHLQTLRKTLFKTALPPEPEPLYDAETGENLSTLSDPCLFSEDLLRAFQPPVESQGVSGPDKKTTRFQHQTKRVMTAGKVLKCSKEPATSTTPRGVQISLNPDGPPGKGQEVCQLPQLPPVRWAEPRDPSEDEEEEDDDGSGSEDDEFMEHRWTVTLEHMGRQQPALYRQIQDIKNCRTVHKQELLDMIEAETKREEQRQCEIRQAWSNKHRYRLNLRHERERKEYRLGIERVRYDYEYLLGRKMIACNLIR